MPRQFAVFYDHPTKGMIHLTELCGETLTECLDKVAQYKDQLTMFHIYMLQEENMPLYGSRFQMYKYRTSLAGKKASSWTTVLAHEYALTHNSSKAWIFSSDIFGDNQQ